MVQASSEMKVVPEGSKSHKYQRWAREMQMTDEPHSGEEVVVSLRARNQPSFETEFADISGSLISLSLVLCARLFLTKTSPRLPRLVHFFLLFGNPRTALIVIPRFRPWLVG